MMLSAWQDGELPTAGMGDALPVQHWREGPWGGGCELWPRTFGSSSPLP